MAMGATESAIKDVVEFFSPSGEEGENPSLGSTKFGVLQPVDVDQTILARISPSTQKFPWPLDVQVLILAYLDLTSVGRSLQVCRSWYLCTKNDSYWQMGILFVWLRRRTQ